jgi:hypothetical protein
MHQHQSSFGRRRRNVRALGLRQRSRHGFAARPHKFKRLAVVVVKRRALRLRSASCIV